MIVVFALVSHRTDCDGVVIDDFEKGYVSGVPEGDDEFPRERASAHLAACERKALENLQPILDGIHRALGNIEIAAVTLQLLRDHEIEEAKKVLLGLCRENDLVTHRAAEALPRALSRRACSLATTVLAST